MFIRDSRRAARATLAVERRDRRDRKDETAMHMTHVERALIAAGVALVVSGGIASAAILWTSATAAAAEPASVPELAAQLGGNPGLLADKGPRGAGLLTAATTYIGIPAADLKTQLAAGKSLADVAVANGKTRDGLITALVAAERQSITTLVDQKGLPFPGGQNGGPGDKGGHVGFGVRSDPLAAAATFLGTTAADLRAKMEGGQTLAQIATAAGKTRDALIAALVSDAKTKIEAAKTAGTITADQATQLESNLTARITTLVDSTEPTEGGPHR